MDDVVVPDTDSKTSGTEYDVFLSFRGPDTRQGFTDCLYHFMADSGIRVYRDDDEMPVGKNIDVLLEAITGSKLCVPIFSKTFAESGWCIREVAKMVELKKEIVPVFYDVDPEDVKLRTSLYSHDLRKQRAKYSQDQVEQWAEALKEVAKIKGRELKDRGFGEFSKMLVKEILIKLRVKHKQVTEYLVGMDDHVDAALKWLDIENAEVRYVGIYGMGGIGKTTLSKVIFNRLSETFDACCFIADVRETSELHGLEHLQKQLLNNLDSKFRDVFDEVDYVKVIREICCKRRILAVLDDVSSREQMQTLVGKSNWFGSGSRIIITTRDKSVLEMNNESSFPDCSGKVSIVEMGTMNFSQANDLLNRHAFGRNSPPDDDYRSLASEVVSIAGGLPLAIEIIGSYLCRKDKSVWKDTIAKLKKVPNRAVKEKLIISYEALEHEQKQIFLDIACLPDCVDKMYATYMWEACGFFPDTSIELLTSMSLVKTIGTNTLWMHDQLKSLGREIVREESLKDPAKRSRLWIHEEALEAIQRKEGKENIEAMYVGDANKAHEPPKESASRRQRNLHCLTDKEFSGLPNVRFLCLEGTEIAGDFRKMMPKLRWLSWNGLRGGFRPTNLYLPNLVILRLTDAKSDRKGRQWEQIKMSSSLKVLDLSYSINLATMPCLSECVVLERLILRSCTKLVELPSSIEKLKSLKYLNLEMCFLLRGLPKEIGSLDSLEELIVTGNGGDFNLPGSVGNLKSLLKLEMTNLRLNRIPQSIGKLVKLRHLSLSNCHGIEILPDSLGRLASLSELNLGQTDISGLPSSVGGMMKLESMILVGCKGMKELPESFGDLKSLTVLNLSHTNIVRLPYSIGGLIKLEKLLLAGCRTLMKLPQSLGSLKMLNELILSETRVEFLPCAVQCQWKLERLSLAGSRRLLELPESLGDLQSLVELDVSWTSLSKLPNIIGDMEELRCIRMKFCNVKELPASIGRLKKLEEFHASHNTLLKKIPEEFGCLSSLRILSLSDTGITHMPSIGQLTLLNTLDLEGCHELEELLELPASLTRLNIVSERLNKVPDLLHLTGLVELALSSQNLNMDCSNLEGIATLTKLEKLQLSCLSLERIPELPTKLSQLTISHLSTETHLPDLSKLNYLSSLQLYKSAIGTKLNNELAEMKSLIDLSVKLCRTQMDELFLPDGLQKLEICRCNSLERLDLSRLMNLRQLHISDCEMLCKVSGSSQLKVLQDIHITRCNLLTFPAL